MRGLFPLRLLGLVLLGVALDVALRVSRAEADYLLYPAGLVVAGLVLVCAVLVALGALSVWRGVRSKPATAPLRLETTHPVATGLLVPRLGRWLLLEVRVDWLEPGDVLVALEPRDGWLAEVVTPGTRGRHERLVRRFTVEDVFGLAQVRFTLEWAQGLVIVPAVAARVSELLPSRAFGDAVAHPAGREEGDLVEMRHYAPGDSLRHILWKTFARTRRLLVRMPERAMAQRPLNVALMVAGPGDEPSAGTARLYVEQGLLGHDFVFAADGATKPTSSVPEAVEQIVDSVRARDAGAAALEALVQQIDPLRLTAFLVFVPPADGPWRERLLALVRRRAAATTVVIGVDRVVEQQPRPAGPLRRWLFGRSPEREASSGVVALRAGLEAAGLTVRVVHRPSGQAW